MPQVQGVEAEELAAGEDREIRERDAYERVAYFLEKLGIS
jgi:hypothetical protein